MGIKILFRLVLFTFLSGAAGAGQAYAFTSGTMEFAQNNTIRTAPPQRQQPSVMQRLTPSSKRETQSFSGHDRVQQAMRNGEIVSLRRIRATVLKSYPGRIVDVQLLELNNRAVPYLYVVKILSEDGRVLDVTLNARDAAILRVQGRQRR
ncbi:hypothetical protein [Emcibacter sp.]|uniref:PepSY domain-containing protein n=1 Tax=Emcibacter sp. TaxID=1979954 RepID=UPI002AA8CA93|nr:hypothetical protein [Emcibacter sp.]